MITPPPGGGRPLRLLFLTSELASRLGTGGVGSYVATTTEALARRGHDVHVLSCSDEVTRPVDTTVQGVVLHRRPLLLSRVLGGTGRGRYTKHRLRIALSNYWHATRLGDFDIVEAPEWQAEGLLFLLRHRRRLIVQIHTPHHVLRAYQTAIPIGRDDRLADGLERLVARAAAAVSCPSQVALDRLTSEGWLGSTPVHLIPMPVLVDRFGAVDDVADTEPRILVVGRLERRKAPELVVDAAILLKRRGMNVTLEFAGRSSELHEDLRYLDWLQLRATAGDLNPLTQQEWLWDDLPSVYARARVVCVPSQFESFSMAAVEGMAAQRPVLCAPEVGAAEIIRTRPHQRLTSDPRDWADALEPLLRDPHEAAVVGRANRVDVSARCDPDVVAARREAVYYDLSGGRNRPSPAA